MPKQNIEKSQLVSGKKKSRRRKSSLLGQALSCHRIGIASSLSQNLFTLVNRKLFGAFVHCDEDRRKVAVAALKKTDPTDATKM